MRSFWFGIYGFVACVIPLGLRCAALFSKKVRQWLYVRRQWKHELEQLLQKNDQWIWMHASSAGEYEDGISIVRELEKLHPGCAVLITFFSASGYFQCSGKDRSHAAFFLPLDTRSNAAYFVSRVSPKLVVFSRHDVWPNFVKELGRRNIPCFLTAFLCTPQSGFFRWPQRNIYRYAFAGFTGIAVQNEETQQLLKKQFALTNTAVCGNPRNARIALRTQREFRDAAIEEFARGRFTITVGSALPKDILLIQAAMKELAAEKIRWIIVPHAPDAENMKPFLRESETELLWTSKRATTAKHTVLWVNTVGILPEIYRYSQLAFVGGGFDTIGIHNVMEPVAHRNFVAFGPHHRNYPEALQLIKSGKGASVKTTDEFCSFVRRVLNDRDAEPPQLPPGTMHALEKHVEFIMKRARA
jgi:3-deoxy-D-manno-octulosonic-acid transferase